MRSKNYIILILAAVLCIACASEPDLGIALHECAPMPSPRASATAFVIGEKAYLFAGRDSTGKQKRHWKTWTPQEKMTERQIEKAVQKVAKNKK